MLWIAGGQLADPTPRPGALCVDGETIAAKAEELAVAHLRGVGRRVSDTAGVRHQCAFVGERRYGRNEIASRAPVSPERTIASQISLAR